MRYFENECLACGEPCLYRACPYYEKIEHFKCDFCKEETKLYHYNGYELCADCILKEFEIVEGSEW